MATIPPFSSPRHFAQYIDHTLLRPDAKEGEISKLCDEALEFSFKSVCVEPKWVSLAASRLKGSVVFPITVISFPHGTDPSVLKIKASVDAVKAGAKEIDMVLNRTLLKNREFAAVLEDIQGVVKECGVPVKVILETSELTDNEKITACVLAKVAGASFVKTSTGFSKSGASDTAVRLMRNIVGPEMGVKASGGIRTYADAVRMVEAGANRLGVSASIAIVTASRAENQVGY
jgi:deoxyribose-phosphate aldolase